MRRERCNMRRFGFDIGKESEYNKNIQLWKYRPDTSAAGFRFVL